MILCVQFAGYARIVSVSLGGQLPVLTTSRPLCKDFLISHCPLDFFQPSAAALLETLQVLFLSHEVHGPEPSKNHSAPQFNYSLPENENNFLPIASEVKTNYRWDEFHLRKEIT